MSPRILPPGGAVLLGLVLSAWCLPQQGIRSGTGAVPFLGIPAVPVPPDNPITEEKVALGKLLFFDPRLSRDGTVACATCHQPDKAYTDARTRALGIGAQEGARNSPTVLNAAYNLRLFWDGRARTLEEQALAPIGNPAEMGFSVAGAVARLDGIEGYRGRFKAAFGAGVTAENLAKAIASFERTLVSGNAPWDRHNLGDPSALSEGAKRGIEIFQHRGRCAFCHIGPTFTDNAFHNLGMGMDKENPDLGRFEITGEEKHIGAFRTPSLRNVAETAPYMHDGSLETLEAVVDFYDKGGTKNPHLDPRIFPRELTDSEKQDLVEFLRSLSGEYPRVEAPELPE